MQHGIVNTVTKAVVLTKSAGARLARVLGHCTLLAAGTLAQQRCSASSVIFDLLSWTPTASQVRADLFAVPHSLLTLPVSTQHISQISSRVLTAMLQRAAQRLVLLPQGMLQAACYSTKLPDDYSLVLRNAQKELASHVATPEKEIGLCAGVPLETLKRKVCIVAAAAADAANGVSDEQLLKLLDLRPSRYSCSVAPAAQ